MEHSTPSSHPTHGCAPESVPDAPASPQELAELRDALARQADELRELRSGLLHMESIEAENIELRHETAELRRRLVEATGRLEDRDALVARLEGVLAGMKSSVSWRATLPLREGRGLLRLRRR